MDGYNNPGFSRVPGVIENFDIEESNYKVVDRDSPSIQHRSVSSVEPRGEQNNFVFCKDIDSISNLKIIFRGCRNSRVFIGANFSGKSNIAINGNNSLIYIGDNCRLNNVVIKSVQSNDLIAVGNGVTTTSHNAWISGTGSGTGTPALIIGDDCMFSYDITVRNSDAHPLFLCEATDQQVNAPSSLVMIEPHVWVGERVCILKDVTIGACSVIALGAIVTKSVPRFSFVKGIPAVAKTNKEIFWARGYLKQQKDKALYFKAKYE